MLLVKRILGSVLSSNMYVIHNENTSDCCLIDIGDFESIRKYIDLNNVSFKSLFITHSHFDHIYGLSKLIEHFPDCTIYISESGKEGLFNDRRNFSFYHERPLNFKGGNIHVVQDGECIELFDGIKMDCFYTPGHDTSCMTFRCGKYLFTGDSYIPNEKPVTKLKGGNKEDYEISLRKILSLIDSDTIVCPGHGEMEINNI